MPDTYKVVITGPFNSGKSTFIRTASDIAVVATERRITTEDRGIKAETTVALDYGRASFADCVLHLKGTPGQNRFNFMWDILAAEMDAFLVLVDAADPPSFPETRAFIDYFCSLRQVPFLVAANKIDQIESSRFPALRRAARMTEEIQILACDATLKSSVRHVLLQMVSLIRRQD